MKASEIASLVGGTLEGEQDPDIEGVAPLDRAGPRQLAFLAHPRYAKYLPRAEAGAVLLARSLADAKGEGPARILVPDVHRALATVLPRLHPQPEERAGIDPTAVIGPDVVLGTDLTLGPYAVIGRGARIGDGVRIGAHAVIGEDCQLGDGVIVHPQVTLYRGVRVGARSILHSGVRLGVDGFGYVRIDGRQEKIPQVGGCEVGEDVEIGANSTVDRGSIGVTSIGDGVKMDNLVHVGHNVRIGDGSVIVAQVGIAGSTDIGRGVTLGGQAGLNGHIEIGDGATIAAQAGVFGDVPPGVVYSGYPARPHKEALRAQAALFRLPQVLKRIRALERALFGREAPGE